MGGEVTVRIYRLAAFSKTLEHLLWHPMAVVISLFYPERPNSGLRATVPSGKDCR
jgi:hypothetical protein